MLYFSLHRFENGFFPGTGLGAHLRLSLMILVAAGNVDEVGGAINTHAQGRTVNVPLPGAMGGERNQRHCMQ